MVGVLTRGEIPRPGGWRGQRRAPPAVAATASQRVVAVAGVVAQGVNEFAVGRHGAAPDNGVLGGVAVVIGAARRGVPTPSASTVFFSTDLSKAHDHPTCQGTLE